MILSNFWLPSSAEEEKFQVVITKKNTDTTGKKNDYSVRQIMHEISIVSVRASDRPQMRESHAKCAIDLTGLCPIMHR